MILSINAYLSQTQLSTVNGALLSRELETLLKVNYEIAKYELNIFNIVFVIYTLGKWKHPSKVVFSNNPLWFKL